MALMKLSDFSFDLAEERIAQRPVDERDASRLMLLDRKNSSWEDRTFRELPELLHGDELMVMNNTRVIPARLFGKRMGMGSQPPGKHNRTRSEYLTGKIEVLLTRKLDADTWEALVRPGRKVRVGERIIFGGGELEAEVTWRGELGLRRLRFATKGELQSVIEKLGHVPLPPYIRREDDPNDRERYQTVFAKSGQAVAAPTAGLHFSEKVLERLREKGMEMCELTLDIGLGTFQPIHVEEVEKHQIHKEPYTIPEETAERIRQAKRVRRPILAVGTTVARALEDAAQKAIRAGHGAEILQAGSAEAEIYIYPGHEFRVVDQMLTNFHLPKSSLFVMTSAFAGLESLLAAYRHAIQAGYRFYSYGDCMLVR